MTSYRNTFSMFSGRQVSEVLAENTQKIQDTVQQAEESYILNVNEEEYVLTPLDWTQNVSLSVHI